MSDVTPDAIVEAVRNAAAQAGGNISRAEFVRVSGICEYQIYRLFPGGGWTEREYTVCSLWQDMT